MAERSTEQRPLAATGRRLERAWRMGDIAISRDLSAAVSFACAGGALIVLGGGWWGGLGAYVHKALADATAQRSIGEAADAAMAAAGHALAWPLALILVVGVVAGLLQTRGNLSSPSARRSGGRTFLGRGSWRLRGTDVSADLVKLTVLAGVAVATLAGALPVLVVLPRAKAGRVMEVAFALGRRLGVPLILAMVVLGIVDYVWQRARHRDRLRMTHEEARREHKESEGDPAAKAERQRRWAELAGEGQPSCAAAANLVVVDPGRSAVAIVWSGSSAEPPVVTVHGAGSRALMIEAAARAGGVPRCIAPALARALWQVAEGGRAPATLHMSLARALIRAGVVRQQAIPYSSGSASRPPAGKLR